MADEEVVAFLTGAIEGDGYTAALGLLDKMTLDEVDQYRGRLFDDWEHVNKLNLENIKKQREAAFGLMKILAGLALAGVGL
jgi:hypothetical protein